MPDLVANVNIANGVKMLTNARKQVLFAEAKACNATAVQIQQFTVGRLLPSKFTLRARGNPWQRPGTKYGFNVKFANSRSAADSIQATIGSQADWLKLQEEGGTKKISGHRIAIPTTFWKLREEIMRREKKPRAILGNSFDEAQTILGRAQKRVQSLGDRIAKYAGKYDDAYAKEANALNKGDRARARAARTRRKGIELKLNRANALRSAAIRRVDKVQAAVGSLDNKPFKAKMPNGTEGIFVRVGRERKKFRMLFKFEDQSPIEGILNFENEGEKIAKANFEKNFDYEFKKAIATSL